ncbi:MAG: SPOR domain-containing protein [Burkholderiales bacterium]|jgi:cell division protein FtsN|nr:SPOR domain-containing protein [Burkholderiales bacterium]
MAKSKQPFRWGILVSGLFVGIVAGLLMAIMVAWQLGGDSVMEVIEGKKKTITAQSGRAKPTEETEKTNYEFYTILPEGGGTSPRDTTLPPPKTPTGTAHTGTAHTGPTAIATLPDRKITPAPTTPTAASASGTSKTKEIYWLQIGSFTRAEDAESRRAELALSGWEATIQKGEAPGRGTMYRVRVGPYDNPEHAGRMRAELSRRFEVAVVKQ